MIDKSNNLSNFLVSNLNITSQTSNKSLNLNLEPIYDDRNHYLCAKCLKFPYIKFCKDRKYIRLTCSCLNNTKILIKDLFETNILSIKNNLNTLLSTNLNINDDIKNVLICKKHNEKFKAFSEIFLENYCQSCINELNQYDFIYFDNIKIEDKKIEQLLSKINDNNMLFEEFNNINTHRITNIDDNIYGILSEEEEEKFNKLINIIINDYKNYPNFSHFFNIKNLLYFFNIEDKPIIEKEEEKFDNKNIINNEPIIIEYNNNISNRTKLFSKTFVKNNKKSLRLRLRVKE